MDDTLLAAQYYGSHYGFLTFPVHGITPATKECTCHKVNCPNAGKHPATMKGLNSSTKAEEVLLNLWAGRSNLNVAIATGPESEIFVLDIDGTIGESSLSRLESQYGKLPETLTSYTGKGRHLIFKYPDRKVYSRVGKLGDGLDVRGEGGYIVAPPSVHKSGNVYEWANDGAEIAESPSWLLDLVCGDGVNRDTDTPLLPAQYDHPTPDQSEWTNDDIRSMLGYLDSDCLYPEWVEIGMALHNEGFPLSLWDEWSRGGTKYQAGQTIKHWKSFHKGSGISLGTLVHRAELCGWKPQRYEPIPLEDHPAKEFLERIKREHSEAELEKEDSTVIPIATAKTEASASKQNIDPMKIPGVVGDTIRAIVDTSQKPQPELAMLNTISALSAVFGRRYASPMDTRTNIYCVGVAATAAGKDHSRRYIKTLMAQAGLSAFIGGDSIISGAGLLTSVQKHPAQILHLDEFGMLLEAMTDKRAAPHMKHASKVLTELYSSSGSTFIGGQYADSKMEPYTIPSPNLCVYGTTTPDKYVESMNKAVITSGELNRYIVIKPKVDRPDRRRYMGSSTPNERLISMWGSFVPEGLAATNSSVVTPEITRVHWTGLEDRVWDMGLFEDEKIAKGGPSGVLWGRYRENCIKIAMIFAICRDVQSPCIVHDDMDIAEAIVRQAVNYMVEFADNNMSDSQHEKNCNDVMEAIKNQGGATRTQISRSLRRLTKKELDDVVSSLMDQDRLEINQVNLKNAKKPSTVYAVK